VTRSNVGQVVVVHRGSRRLYLYHGMRLVRRFSIAVGMPRYPTPIGRFTIVRMERNPTWDPPNSDWAAGLGPVPPGPGNPLGTRWMGLSAPGIGIHGTPAAYSIGTAASHGCIRMYIREAEWLFARVRVGTSVFIVRA
jgi:lipoprotein-anchoring transpeptidase ErfK/SrfK